MPLRGALGSGLGARDAAAFCVAGVAQPYIHLRFTWQAWHNLTSTFVLRGRRGTLFDTPSFTHHFVTHHLSHTTLSHTIFHHTLFHTSLCHHTIFHTQLCHTPSFTTPCFTHNCVTHHLSPHHISHPALSHTYTPSSFVTHHLSHSTLSRTAVLTFRSFTTSFAFPSFSVPATTFGAHYWKKLPCGVIRSFNSLTHPQGIDYFNILKFQFRVSNYSQQCVDCSKAYSDVGLSKSGDTSKSSEIVQHQNLHWKCMGTMGSTWCSKVV